MAKIRDQEEQRKALRNIISSLKEIEAANEFLGAENPGGKYTITFTGQDGKKHSTEIGVKDKDDINVLILSHKEQEKERLHKLAEDNGISLDPEDEEILNYQLQEEAPAPSCSE